MFPLYCILDRVLCEARGLEPLTVADAFLAGGAKLLQVRDKHPSSAQRLALAEAVAARCHAAGAQLVVNDYPDIARLSGADGVHVGQEDLGVEDARTVVGNDAIVGVSTHTDAQIQAAARTTASYIAVGPIYDTATKNTGYTARGLELIQLAVATGKPVVAIGGITLARAAEARFAGAASLAVISDLLTGGDPAARVAAFVAALRV